MALQDKVVIIDDNNKKCELLLKEVDKYRLYYEFGFDVRYIFDIETNELIDLEEDGYRKLREDRMYRVYNPQNKSAPQILQNENASVILETAFYRSIDLCRVAEDPSKIKLAQSLDKLGKLLLQEPEKVGQLHNLIFRKEKTVTVNITESANKHDKDDTSLGLLSSMKKKLLEPLILRGKRSGLEQAALLAGSTTAVASVAGVAGSAAAAGMNYANTFQ